jgi:spore germination protein YaaH
MCKFPRMRASLVALLFPALCAAQPAPRPLESIWYVRNDSAGIASFVAHAAQVTIVAPQVYAIDSAGRIRGGTDARIVAAARAHGVQLHPLVMNPGFDLGILHHIVTDRGARTASARSMAELCRRERLDGIQLDLENLFVGDRDAFTAFAREVADSVHAAGCQLSAAVVPRTDDVRGERPYHQWMYDYWRGAYDYKALAEVLDFLSYMTYAQHTGGSTPGPVAGYPWMRASLEYLLAQGVPPGKISLGLAGYSDHWYAGYTPRTGDARPVGEDIAYPRLMEIIRAAGASPRWDETQRAWVAMWETRGVFEHAWIEDARAFESKLQLVRQHGLRGYSVWLLGLEDPRTWEIVGPVRPGNARGVSR